MKTSNDLTFGIEIECFVPNAHRTKFVVGRYHAGTQIPCLPQGWQGQSDASIRADAGYFPIEIVSPILQGEDGLIQVVYVIDTLNQLGVKVNRSCGLHIHVGSHNLDRDGIARLMNYFISYEKVFFALSGTQALDRWENHFCRNSANWNNTRYQSLNLENLHNRKKTIEIRCFAGTLSVETVVSAVYLACSVVAHACNDDLPLNHSLTRDLAMLTKDYIMKTFGHNNWIYRMVKSETHKDLIDIMLGNALQANPLTY